MFHFHCEHYVADGEALHLRCWVAKQDAGSAGKHFDPPGDSSQTEAASDHETVSNYSWS